MFKRNKEVGSSTIQLIASLGFLSLMVLMLIGWVMNIISIAQSELVFTGMMVLRIIGIFVAPLGGVLGWV